MSRTAAHFLSASFVALAFAAAHALAQPPQPKGPEARSIVFEIRVPAEAEIEIQGKKMSTTGEVRQYRTPPVPLGRRYSYRIKVTYEGKASEYDLPLTHGGTNVLDLQKVLQKPKPPEPVPPPKSPSADAKKPPDKPKPHPADLPQDDGPPKKPEAEKKPESKKPGEKKP